MILRTYKKPNLDPARDLSYLRWIRTLPCAVCDLTRWIEAAHIGERGLGRKCPDRQTIPLCPFHHRTGPTSHHALGRRFWMRWNIDRYELIRTYNAKFEKEK